MARKGTKRAVSAAKKSSDVASKCRKIASVIQAADAVPKPVRSMICDTLVRTFTTYKEDRHAFQNSASSLVSTILKAEQGKIQQAITEAQQKKASVDAEAGQVSAANDAALAASEAAAKAFADSKTAVSDSKTALKDAKTHLHELEVETKAAEVSTATATTRKGKLEALANDFIPQVKAGTQTGARAGNHVTKDVESSVALEFVPCVTRTFSKPVSSWGTFDKIVAERLDGFIQKSIAELSGEISSMATAKDTRATNVEAAKAAIAAAEEKVKAMDEASTAAAAAAKEAEAAAVVTAKTFKTHQGHVSKAAAQCKVAEDTLVAFANGPLAAFTEVESRKAPEPEPATAAEPAAAPVAAAMAPVPSQAAARPSILPSPAVLLQSARNILTSPRVAQSPQPSA